MELEKQMKFVEYFKERSDVEIKEAVLSGKESFQEGVFEIILAEAHSRKIEINPAQNTEESKGYDTMSRAELLDLLIKIDTLDELNFHLISAEAIMRKISRKEINEYERLKYGDKQETTPEIDSIENPQPLLIVKNIETARPIAESLSAAQIPFEVQINVDEENYRKAEIKLNEIKSKLLD